MATIIDKVVENGTLPAQHTSAASVVDVVVIGAGLAGLTAARHITRAGHSCVVLEARNRVGGRTWSQRLPSGEAIYENGAAWINDTNQSRMYELAKEFAAEFIEQNSDGDILLQETDKSMMCFPYGQAPDYPEDIKANVIRTRDTVESVCQSLSMDDMADPRAAELDSMTFHAYLQKLGANEQALHTGTIWTRAMLGQDASDISALFFLLYCKAGGGLMQMRSDRTGGGQHLRIRRGTQTFSEHLAECLPKGTIRFESPVTSIRQIDRQSVLIACHPYGPVIRARKVLSAVPQPVIKTIDFTPPLPSAKQRLVSSYFYGYYQKVLVSFKSPFWTQKGACGLVQSYIGPIAVIRDTSVPVVKTYVLTCFVGGSVGKAWSKLPTLEQRQEMIIKQLCDMFQDEQLVRSEYVEMSGHQWSDERWNGYGCPSPALAPGVLSAVGDALTQRVGDVHFAGTETSNVWRGYMEGAVRSGEREAALILKDL